MKRILLLSSCLALSLSLAGGAGAADYGPAPVGLLLSGDLGVYVGLAKVSDPDDEFDDDRYPLWGGTGAISIPFLDNFSVQLDAFAERNNVDTDDDGATRIHGFGGHLSFRDPTMGLIGVFGGIGRADASDDEKVRWAGVEGQYYFDNITLYGQLGWMESNSDHDALDFDHLFARGVARYFLNDDMLLEGELAYTQGTIHGEDMDLLGWGAKFKFGLFDTPLYMSVGYRGTHGDENNGEEATEHLGFVGLSIPFGTHTLMEKDRLGATLDTPTFQTRAANWTSALD